jgi:hypothetical protein
MNAFDSLLPSGEGGAKRRMREWQSLANHLHYKRTIHSLIRPSGTFSQRAKEKLAAFATEFYA